MKRMKLTTAGRVVIFVIVLALLAGIGGFGYNYYKNNIADDKPISSGTQSGSTSQKPTTKPSAGKTDTSDPVINLSLDELEAYYRRQPGLDHATRFNFRPAGH